MPVVQAVVAQLAWEAVVPSELAADWPIDGRTGPGCGERY